MSNGVLKLAAGIALIGLSWAQDRGMIAGTVIDETGKALAGAKVLITEKDVFEGHRFIDYHETDGTGRFKIAHVRWGTYVVTAGKKDAGYPDAVFAAFYSSHALPNVTLREDFPSADIIVKIGPKAGILNLEPVTDEATGKEIRSASVILRRAENPELFLNVSTTQERIFVPALTDVLVEIAAEGYKSWPPPDRASEGKLLLKPEEIYKLKVALQPEKSGDGKTADKP